jgi:hypothetical protein
MPSTIRLHRVLHATPSGSIERSSIRDAKAKWLPKRIYWQGSPHRPRVGGSYKMSFTNFTRVRATPSADSTSNWCPTSEFAIRISLTIQICPARCK